jgi:hypothetical protein
MQRSYQSRDSWGYKLSLCIISKISHLMILYQRQSEGILSDTGRYTVKVHESREQGRKGSACRRVRWIGEALYGLVNWLWSSNKEKDQVPCIMPLTHDHI